MENRMVSPLDMRMEWVSMARAKDDVQEGRSEMTLEN